MCARDSKNAAILAIGGLLAQARDRLQRAVVRSVAANPAACFDIAAMIGRGKAEIQAARSERLSAALRENLKRRKAQARRRTRRDAPDQDSAAADAKTEPAAPDFRRNPGRE
jgi:hypothetical protein